MSAECLETVQTIPECSADIKSTLTNTGIVNESNNTPLSVNKSTISDGDSIIEVDNLNVNNVLSSDNVNQKLTRKHSKSHSGKKDKCPCQVSDTSSWKLRCSKCDQTWHTACCNLKGIISITELDNWECPWCYVPLFCDPSKPKAFINTLKDIQRDINNIQSPSNSISFTELHDEISELKKYVHDFIANPVITNESANKIHDDILTSVNFDLAKVLSDQNTALISELSEIKNYLSAKNLTQMLFLITIMI